MILGVLKDIKEGEYRVICTPTEVATIVAAGHQVLAQKDCGKAAGFPNKTYEKAGAEIVESAEEMYSRCDMVAKVKEFEESEYGLIRENQ
ncbi:MAG: alanine dehydrogenase, partial [Sedimentibacter sp.]|nr:alanine dehydrogenase [Sedimentibacter sp.]